MQTEKEKMLLGVLYDANNDKSLAEDRFCAKDLCLKFNNTKASNVKKQKKILKKLLPNADESCTIIAPFWCDYGYNIKIGKNFFSNHNLTILDCAKVEIGENVFIAPNCGIYTAGHPLDYIRRNQGLEFAHPIKIGNNVWIGAGVSILPGVTIGDNCVIGAGSVVTKDIPSNVIAVGNPCKVLRKIDEKDAKNEYKYIKKD